MAGQESSETAPGYTLTLEDSELMRYRRQTADAVRAEADLWRRAGVIPGARVADVGCGPGLPLLELARMVSPHGSAIGVERGAQPRQRAATAIREAGLAAVAQVIEGQADATGLEPGHFSVVMMRHVLLHNSAALAQPIVDHLASLLEAGGHLIIVETDRLGQRFERTPEPVVAEMQHLHLQLLESNGGDLSIGPKLGALAERAGLEIVERSARYDVVVPQNDGRRPYAWSARGALISAGLASPADVERWDQALSRLGPNMEPVSFIPMFVVAARRPA